MNKKQAEKILQELHKRTQGIDLLATSFPEQTDFIKDESKLKFALTCRRAGKSYAAALMLYDKCINGSDITCAYIGLTRDSAKNVIIPHLKEIKKNFNIKCRFMKSPASVQFPNGSSILFFGINDTEEEREKLLGQHFKLAIIDEGASYNIDLKAAIKDFIQPTLWDDDGQLVIIGTPGNLRNYFCDITEGRIPGWSRHFWLADKNPRVREQYLKEIEEQKALYPNIEEDSGFQQHYLGKWTIDETKKAYKCRTANYIESLPNNNYHYILGMDLGWEDENSFVVGAYADNDPTLYFIYSYSKNHMLMDDVIDKIKEIESKYTIENYIIDAANKQYVEELRYRTKRPFKPATKQEKINYVHLMNSDFAKLKLKVIPTSCQSLLKEYDYLTIDDSNPLKPKILGGDHNADAALYLWRASYHYNSQKPIEEHKSPEDIQDEWWDKEADKLNKQKEMNFIERDWQ